MFVCAICPIEDLIGKLPSRLSASNAEQVQAQIDEIYTLYDALTDEEQQQVDLSPCVALLSQMDGMDSAVLDDGSGSCVVEFELPENPATNKNGPYVVDEPTIIITKGNTLTRTGSNAIQVTETGKLYLGDGGAIVSQKGAGVEVQSGGFLSVTEPGTAITGSTYALDIASGAEVHLSAGTYSGGVAAIHMADGNYAGLLEDGFAFFDGGNAITPENLANAKTLTVGQCTNHAKGDYTAVDGSPTHTWSCACCGAIGTEKCTFNFVQDGNGTSTCADCHNSLTIAVDESDLSNLVYDGTVKPEDVDVTVTLTGPDNKTTTLTKETDFSVNIEKITDAGQAKVTVTGITFNGTFVKTYTVKPDKPGLSWGDSNPVTVNYDGAPVEAGDLPAVKINIQSTIDDLQGYLQYSYKKQGDTNYISGLPKDAGTYDVIVSLPELPNFEGAVSDPITLTVNPINPIATAPAAKTLTYNRTAQELVTAGKLDPVAERDGLEIQFATEENGTYSTAIPTGTDARDYTVWYQVTGLTDNYIAPDPNPAQVADVKILRKPITPVVTLSQYSYLYDGGFKEPTVTVKDADRVTDLPDTEYTVSYENHQNVSTDTNPAKVVVTDSDLNGGNYTLTQVEVKFKITRKTQDTLSITNKPSTFTYGDKFTLQTSGGSGNGLVTWEITSGEAQVGQSSGQVVITGHGEITVKATKSGTDPDTGMVNYENATAVWTFTADKKPVTATVTAEDKDYDGKATAIVHAVVKNGVLAGDEIKIEGLTGTFSDENAGADKTVTVVVDADGKPAGATIGGKNSEHYDVTYSATTVTATIRKAVAKITTPPVAASLTYNGTAQALIAAGAVVDPADVPVEYALSENGPYSTDFPKGTNAGTYTVWYRVKETDNYTGLAPASVDVTINKKSVNPTITLDQDTFTYDGTAKKPVVTLYEDNAKTITIPAGEYTVAYSNNINVSTADTPATVTVTAKDGGNYSFTPVTKNFTINKEQAKVLTAPEAAGHPLTFNTFAQRLVTAGTASGGTMVYRVGDTGEFKPGIPEETDAGAYTVYYKVAGDSNHSDLPVQGPVAVTIGRKLLTDITIELVPDSFQYDGAVHLPTVTVKDGDTVLPAGEYSWKCADNAASEVTAPTQGGTYTITVSDKTGGNYDLTGANPNTATFTIGKAAQAELVIEGKPAVTNYGDSFQLTTSGGSGDGGLTWAAVGGNADIDTDGNVTIKGVGEVTISVVKAGDDNYQQTSAQWIFTAAPKPVTAAVTANSKPYDGTTTATVASADITADLETGDTVTIDQASITAAFDDPHAGTGKTVTLDTSKVQVTGDAAAKYAISYPDTVTADITQATTTVDTAPAVIASLTYNGQPQALVTAGQTNVGFLVYSLSENGEYSREIPTGTNAGTYTVYYKVDETADYTGVATNTPPISVTIGPKDITATVKIELSETSYKYDGTKKAPKVTVKDGDTVIHENQYTVTWAGTKSQTETDMLRVADTYKATITNVANGNYTFNVTAAVEITPAEQTAITITGKPEHVYYGDTITTLGTTGGTGEGTVTWSVTAGDTIASFDTNTNVLKITGVGAVTVRAERAVDNYGTVGDNWNFTVEPKPVTAEVSVASKTYDGTTAIADGDITANVKTADLVNGDTVALSGLKGAYTDANAGTGKTVTLDDTNATKADGNGKYIISYPATATGTITAKDVTVTVTLSDHDLKTDNTVDPPVSYYEYDGTVKEPNVTVKYTEDSTDKVIPASNYTVEYSNNKNVSTTTEKAAVTVTAKDGGNYIVNGSVTFEITKAAPTVTAPTEKTGLQYNGELQDLVSAGVTSHGAVVYSVNGGNYSSAIPTASAVDTYVIDWKVQGDANHSDTTPATLTVKIDKNTVNNPTITLSQNQFTYNGSQQKPTITVYNGNSRLIPEYEYTVDIKGTNGNAGMVNVDTYTVTIAAVANSNYEFQGDTTREFKIVPADQETISITGTPAQVRYGDAIQLGVSGGTGDGTVTWTVAAKDGSTTIATGISSTGLLTVKDVNTSIKVTVTRSKDNYGDVSASWEFTAAKKPVTADVTVAAKNWDGTTDVANTAITATVKTADLAFSGDNITITGLTGAYDNANGTGKTVTLTGGTVGGTNADKYDVTIPATATASILAAAATVDTAPEAVASLTYDASQSQALITAGSATGGTMVYSLDGKEFTPTIPKGKDAGTYTVYYKAQGDQNHTDSEPKTVGVTIVQQSVTPQIELSPPSGQYDGTVQQPAVTARDTANNVIPANEYKVTYVSDNGENWKDQGTYTVKVENITGGNYIIADGAKAEFEISTSAQAPLEIVNKPGLVYYGDTFTLSATGGSGSETVTWSSSDTSIADIDANGFVTIKGTGSATITATKAGGGNYDEAKATYPLNALQKPITAIVTADDKVFDGNTNATIHITWRDGDLINSDTIQFSPAPTGTFDSDAVGTNKQVTVNASVVNDATAQKYDITIPATTTASITKATATAPTVTGNTLTYTGSAQSLVTGGGTNTLYSTTRDGVYSSTVPTGTNAGTYTVWYKAQGDANHNDSEPQSIEVTITRKPLTASTTNVTLSGNDLKTDTDGNCYYEYDGTEKQPTVTIKDGAAEVPSSEYTVTYTDNKNVGTSATVTITDSGDGNYNVSGSVTFEIRRGGAQLTKSPEARNLTYTGAAQELVTVGIATGGRIQYKLTSAPAGEPTPGSGFSTNIPTGTKAGTYTVDYKVVGDSNHTDGPTGSVTVTIHPKTVVSPKITVTGTYTYDSTAKEPGTAVTVVDGNTTIPDTEYTLSYQNNVNAGTATVIVADNNGGNYTVNGTATFEIGKAAGAVGAAPTGKTGLHYNGTAQELLDTLGTATGGTLVYSLTQDSGYSAAIPTGKNKGNYTVYYKVQGDGNHEDTEAQSVTASIGVNNVTNPTIQVTPESVKYTGKKQEPTITVKDDDGLLIDGSEYEVTYADTANSNNSDLTHVGTYTVTITGVTNGNYTFNTTKTATFTITQADQTALTITGTRERVYYGDTIQLGVTGGVSGGTVTWDVGGSTIASIDTNGLLKITGTGSVVVTATSTKTGYADQTATWALYADKKPVTAVVTAAAKTYDGTEAATVTATLQASDFVGTDSFTITLTGCTFEDPNAGTDKKVNVVSTNPTFTPDTGNHENYAITYPNTTTASILKAAVTDVTAPEGKTGLTYTGNPQALVTAGSSTDGTLEYSLDGRTYSASLPTGTDAGDYDVWYRVKGDGNHNDAAPVKLTETDKVTIAPQDVTAPIIEFTPDSASYDGAVHKPSVTVKDANHRVIPGSEYTVTYSNTDWKTASSAAVKHIVTITGKSGGNYKITAKTAEFTISMMGQNPLSIVGQPGEVRYGDSFTLSTTGGSGTGTVTWNSSDTSVATIGANGLVKTLKSGSTTITATKQADANYGAVSVTWALSVEKKPVTAIVTAKDKEYDTTDTATLVITWKDGDLVGSDTITLNLTGKFDTADAGTGKTVTITGTAPNDDRYAITIPQTTTASITPKAATLSGTTNPMLTYTGSAQDLVTGITATNGEVAYSTDGSYYTLLAPTGTNAGTYPVWYKAQGSGNYKDSDPVRLNVTIQPKTVSSPTIELSPDSFEYDGTPKKPDVVVKDGNIVISPSEYTVSYSNNIDKGAATVTISDNAGGNYTVSGSKTFTITAAVPTLTAEPQPKDLTYTGRAQALVTAGSAVNGKVIYSLDGGEYSTAIPKATEAGDYEVAYKVVDENGNDATTEDYIYVTIDPKEVTPTILLNNQASYSATYTGSAQTPTVTVKIGGETVSSFTPTYSNNTKVGTATVTVQSTGGNYKFFGVATFEITKGKASFLLGPEAKEDLVYTGEPQELVQFGMAAQSGLLVVYSTDNLTYLPAIPTGINRGNYVVIAKVQGNEFYEDSDPVAIRVTIDKNVVSNPTVTLSSSSFPYTGGEQKPTVTVTDDGGNAISADEYTVTYSDNVAVGTAKVSIKSKPNGNYSFTVEKTFTIVDANQTPLVITGKKDAVYYGDTLNLGAIGGSGDGAVTWSETGPVDRLGDGQYKVTSSGSVTITATKAASGGYGETKDTWTFYAQPKPVTATVTAANKVYNGDTNATLTVTLSGLLPGDKVATNTDDGVKATGQFADETVGTNKAVTITSLSIPDAVSAKYAISHSGATTASITPAPAAVTAAPTLTTGSLTYNGGAQALLANDGTAAVGGNLMYSLDGKDYRYTIPTGTDAKTYTVWYKVEAADDNHKDSAAVKLGDVTIAPNVDTPSILCTPGTLQYDGTEKTPTVVVRDSAQRIIPESEYTVTFDPGTRIAVGTYTVTVADKPGGNYSFTNPVTGTFEIVPASQNPLSIVTDIPTDVHYGDTFRLSAMGGSGSGAIQWSVEGNGNGTPATITATGNNCVVTVTGTGGFTVKAFKKGADGYSDSNTDSVPFEAKPKPVTPVVTASDKSYDGKTDATLTATWKNGDLVNGDTIALTVSGAFDTADAGTNKRVNITEHTATGTNADKYAITWPDSTTASIYKVDAKLATAPAGADLTYSGSAQELVSAGTTVNGIGKVEYSTSQNGAYSQTIPTGTNVGAYTVWYKVADSVNYTGITPASIQVEIKKANPVISTYPTASGTAGQKLSEIRLEGGATNTTGGTFAWESPETETVAGTAYNVIFTPDDTANYNTVTIQVTPVSASSGGGTGGTSTTPPVDTVSDSTQTTIQNGTANTVLSAADGNRLVKEAVQNQSDTIVIKPEITGDVSKTQVSIPASTVSQINSQTDAALTVASPIADVTIPNGALDALGSAGGTVNVVTEQVGDAVALTLTAGGETVDSVPGGVTLTVPAEDAGAGTVAVLVHDDGTREVLQRSVVKDGKLSAPLSGSATVEIVDNGKTFADVQPTDWAAEAVTFASARELFNGTSETTFSPEETTSRGMVATVLYRLEGQPEQALADVYNDVSDDAWYADSVAWAAKNGIVNGYGDGQFGPNDSVTREQFVVMLWRYVGSPEANSHDLTAFTDANQINGYALEALCWAVENGVLNGNGNGRLAPEGTATRAEAAQILKNFIENI